MSKQQQIAHNLLAPHMRLLQFLGSHFNATRLGSPHTEKAFLRLLDITLEGLKHSTGHPLSREIRFQIVLFGLKVLRHSTAIDLPSRFRIKDQILSAALSWFAFPPRWSFGGNRLQLKAETRLLSDVSTALQNVAMTPQKPSPLTKSLQAKEALLQALIESELVRLTVWLYPLNEPRDSNTPNLASKGPSEASLFSSTYTFISDPSQASLLPLVRTAWKESPSLALQLIARFPLPRLQKEIRWLLLNFPDKAISEPEAVHVLLGGSLPSDISYQLKVCTSAFLSVEVLTTLVSLVLGSSKPYNSSHFVFACLPQPPLYSPICHACSRKSLGRCDLFLRSSNSADPALRCPRLC